MAAQEDYEQLTSLAERLGLDEKSGGKFVNESMQRLGYKPKVSWDEAEQEGGDDDGGSFFGGGGQRKRSVGGGGNSSGNGGGNRGGGGWQYDN